MLTVIETPTFARLAVQCWEDDDRTAFIDFIAGNPDAGDVVPGSGGLRKIRWGSVGRGKRGGVRVIYFNRLANGEVWLLLVYPKSVRDNIPANVLREIKKELDDG
ncbi:transcriptional regulator [Methylosinus sporium]|uniref:Transcriptional regulator n=1 Tax=Methylosinus sporium TaxID=428 RepID=A0A549T2J6_METSR|nr:transcriptional regulator [Methylosinus sporium]MBU3890066.1 type II toxin-antitoxin system RelE/ParE family toxin [Methylosinus sp. KRF6]TRL36107.1 transcriptional regulator [Methylosinus sporium]